MAKQRRHAALALAPLALLLSQPTQAAWKFTPTLELALEISKRYGFQLRSDDEDNQRIFASLSNLSAHIEKNRVK